MADKFFLFGIFLIFMMTILSTVVLLSADSDPQVILSGEKVKWHTIFDFFILYSPFIPISLYGIYDIVLLIKRKNVQNFWKSKNEKGDTATLNRRGEQIKVIDPNILPNLGQIDYCFFDKSGTLTSANYKVKTVFLPGKPDSDDGLKIYSLDHEYLSSNIAEKLKARQHRLENQKSNKNLLNPMSLIEEHEPSQSILNMPTPNDKNAKNFQYTNPSTSNAAPEK